MPRIEVMNIKFNLDSNEVDAEVYAALCEIPRGKRSSVVKELLHAALCMDESLPKWRDKPDRKVVTGSLAGHPLPHASSPTPVRKSHSEQTDKEKGSAPTAAVEQPPRTNGDTKVLDEFRSLIY